MSDCLAISHAQADTFDRMAEAIENSYVVLMCVSPHYEASVNCKLEAEYIFQKKVPFIPLMMVPGYHPRGWLGLMLGQRLYYNFSNPHVFDRPMQDAIKEIRTFSADGKGQVIPAPAILAGPVSNLPPVSDAVPEVVLSPEQQELKDFLDGIGAGEVTPTFLRNKIDMEVLADCTSNDIFQMGVPLGLAKRIVAAYAARGTNA